MAECSRGIPVIDFLDEMPGQTAVEPGDHGAVIDHADGTATEVNLPPAGARPAESEAETVPSTPAIGVNARQDGSPPAARQEVSPPSARRDESPAARAPKRQADSMVIRDPSMAALMRRLEHVAPSNATVLIIGESGTGKELIATHLHRCSGRQGGPFVAINCAGIPDALLESELFGHEKGAFYGAMSRHIGKFEAANGGTLLLDEIGEMDLRMQAKVLRAVQQREIDRVGGKGPVPIDVRIVATTNRNLHQEVRQGRFRADLLFRLNVIALRVPPLRERPADIPALAEFFARKFARANGRSNGLVTPDAMAPLLRHPWPGNVRELENVMHRAVLIETGPSITSVALDIDTVGATTDCGPGTPPPAANSAYLAAFDTGSAAPAGPRAVPSMAALSLAAPSMAPLPTAGRTIEAVEKDMILDTLYRSKGNRSQAASVLGISIRTLRNKLHEYERNGTPIPRPVIIAVS